MDRLYECDLKDKNELNKILESDPYSKDSISRIGYVIKDGSALDADKDKVYIYISAPEDKVKIADQKLKEIAKIVEGENADKIIKHIKDEQNNAATGFGNIFG